MDRLQSKTLETNFVHRHAAGAMVGNQLMSICNNNVYGKYILHAEQASCINFLRSAGISKRYLYRLLQRVRYEKQGIYERDRLS